MGWWVGSGHSRPDDAHGRGLGERHAHDPHHDRSPAPDLRHHSVRRLHDRFDHFMHRLVDAKNPAPAPKASDIDKLSSTQDSKEDSAKSAVNSGGAFVTGPPMPSTPMSMAETPLNRLAFFAAIAGVLTGLLVAAVNWSVLYTEQKLYGATHFSETFLGSMVSPTRLSITLFLVGLFGSWIWYLLRKFGRPAVSVPGAMDGTPMPVLETLVSIFTQAITVAAGAPVGRENAPRLAGGLVASRLSHAFHLDPQARRIIIASAAGAGLAASFHLPLAGALFALELLLVEMSTRTIVSTMLASATAVATIGIFIEPHPVFASVELDESSPQLIAAIIVGLITGLLGHGFGLAARRAAAARPLGANILWEMPIVFLALAVAAHFISGVSGSGRWAAEQVFTAGMAVHTLIFLAIIRAVAIILCFRAGTVGGTLTPAFSLGAVLGALIGYGISPLLPGVTPAACALMGAAAFLSTTMAAPMFGMIAAVEFTDMAAQGYLAMFVSVVAAAVGVRILGIVLDKDVTLAAFTTATWTGRVPVHRDEKTSVDKGSTSAEHADETTPKTPRVDKSPTPTGKKASKLWGKKNTRNLK